MPDAADPTPATPTAGIQRWRLVIAYDGAGFRGFAAQPGLTTVAGALTTALARATRAEPGLLLVCAGRTDAGVHARGQVVHVDLPITLPTVRTRSGAQEMGPAELVHALNRQLSPRIVVRGAERVAPSFDARRSATGRRYRYLVWNSPFAEPLLSPVAWHIAAPLDLRAMRTATDPILGQHDFRAFCRRPPGTDPAAPIVRRVHEARWTIVGHDDAGALVSDDPDGGLGTSGAGETGGTPRRGTPEGALVDAVASTGGRLLRFDIAAGSFCHQMVRSLVGALVVVGRGGGTAATMMALLSATDRVGAPDPAPAHGLSLESVTYGPSSHGGRP